MQLKSLEVSALPSGMAGSWGLGDFRNLLGGAASPQTSFPPHGSKRPPAAPDIFEAPVEREKFTVVGIMPYSGVWVKFPLMKLRERPGPLSPMH